MMQPKRPANPYTCMCVIIYLAKDYIYTHAVNMYTLTASKGASATILLKRYGSAP